MPAERPLPDVEAPLSAPFWKAAAAHRLELQTCSDCGHVRWPAASSCPECLSTEFEWKALSGRGTIWSLAIYDEVPEPFFSEEVPYAIGAISLEEGPMMISRVHGDPDRLEVGEAVRAVFDDVSGGATLVEWEPHQGGRS